VASGDIKFDPALEVGQWGQASIDLRLGAIFTMVQSVSELKVSLHAGLAPFRAFFKTVELPLENEFGQRNSFCLEPNGFILAMTYETVSLPRNLIALVEGRSTYARVGLSVHQRAPWIQPGWSGPIVLEIKNQGPMRVELTPLLDRPCQLTVIQLAAPLPPALAYGGKSGDRYVGQSHPVGPSRSK
jgi:dCTP deaminase